MGRTTLMIDDDLIRRLKQKAAAEGRTLQAVTNALLRQALARVPRRPFTLRLTGWNAEQQPGVDLADRDSLFDLMNGR
jgi:plasmid stability protein